MGETNNNPDLEQKALEEFNIEDVKDLLEQLKEGSIKDLKQEIKELDDNDTQLSETEKKLYEQSKEALDIVNFLEWLVKQLEIKENNDFIESDSDILNIEAENMNVEQAKRALKYTNDNYKQIDERNVWFFSYTLATIDDYKEIHIFQEKLIKKIFESNWWVLDEGAWYDKDWNLFWFNKEKWNYIITLKEFSSNLEKKEIKDINSKALASYFLYLDSIWKLNERTLMDIMWKEKFNNLKELWEKDKNTLAQTLLKKSWLNNITETLSLWLEWYNHFSNEYYLKNKENIIKISNKKKFLEAIIFIKEKNPTEYLLFISFANPSFRNDFNLLKKFYKINKEKFSYSSIKDINFNLLNKNEKIEFLEMINKDVLNIILLQNETSIRNLKYKKYTDKLNNLKNNNKISEDVFFEDESTKTDNTLIKKIKDNTEDWIKILEDLSTTITDITKLPKTFNYILSNEKLINLYLKNHSYLYNLLPIDKQKKHNLEYIDSVLKHSNYIARDLAILQFIDLDNLINAYQKIKKEAPNIIQDLLSRPLFKLTLINSQKEHQGEIEWLSEKNKNILKEILLDIKDYWKKIKEFKTTYNDSKFKDTLETNKNNNYINKLYQNKDFLNFLKKQNIKIQWAIVEISEITLWNWSEWKNIEDYLSIIAENKNKGDFKKILKDINTYINENILSTKEDIKNTEIEDEDKELLQKYLKEGKPDIDKIHKDFLSYLIIKRKEWKKISNNDYEKYLNEFLEEKWINKISDKEILNRIEDYLKAKKWQEIFENITKESDKLYKVLKSWDKEKIKEFFKEIDSNYYSNLENEVKEYEEKEKIEKHLESINNRNIVDITYGIDFDSIPSKITENNSIKINWNEINNISKEEFEQLEIKDWKVWNPEALKNLVDMNQKLDELWLEFVWENRKSIIKIMNNNSEFKASKVNANDTDLMDKREFNVLLQFILKINWEKNPSNIESDNYAKILKINNIWAISDKKDTFSWLSNIWKKFIEIWFFNSSWWINISWENNLRQYVISWYKNKETMQ